MRRSLHLLAAVGVVAVQVFTRQEETYVRQQFGAACDANARSVPSMNILAGSIRALRRRGGD